MFRRLMKDKRGLTLVEVMVAFLILMIIIAPFISALMVGRVRIINEVKQSTMAMNLLRAQMEWVKAKAPDYFAVPDEDWINISIVEDDVDGGLYNDTRTTTVTKDANGNLIVTVTLNWAKQGWGGSTTKGTASNPDEQLVTLITEST